MSGAVTELAAAPLVSCLMVTRGGAAPARFAIDCFRRQTYPARELVIVCDRPAEALRGHLDALADPMIRLVAAEPAPLGALRNVSVAEAKGDLVCQWDDDDLCAPERIASQAAAIADFDAIFLQRWMLWSPKRHRLAISGRRVWEGSMLARKACVPAYPPLTRNEDTPVAQAIDRAHRIGLLDEPALYCYVGHGANACGPSHFDMLYANATRRFEFAAYEPALAKLAAAMPIADYRAAVDTG